MPIECSAPNLDASIIATPVPVDREQSLKPKSPNRLQQAVSKLPKQKSSPKSPLVRAGTAALDDLSGFVKTTHEQYVLEHAGLRKPAKDRTREDRRQLWTKSKHAGWFSRLEKSIGFRAWGLMEYVCIEKGDVVFRKGKPCTCSYPCQRTSSGRVRGGL